MIRTWRGLRCQVKFRQESFESCQVDTMDEPIKPASQLSADIHLLGDLLGQIIREQHGQAALDLVERVRLSARAARNGDQNATVDLTRTVHELDLASQRILIKAFTNYF